MSVGLLGSTPREDCSTGTISRNERSRMTATDANACQKLRAVTLSAAEASGSIVGHQENP